MTPRRDRPGLMSAVNDIAVIVVLVLACAAFLLYAAVAAAAAGVTAAVTGRRPGRRPRNQGRRR